ncbi:class I SAM-dependent methyltransferase [Thalassospira marina]|uniref:Methyltransferase type 11 domain-containing protein n=1 Tax=Thalassospira marina TaxID=2048283 RepID=A0ABN5FMG4_9PROT|nr:class I SAM-dependent methyltransferase [Thalassospira marina]AUG55902.1 hypothetical protein CSC3H3_24120 [Thalassospira marina]
MMPKLHKYYREASKNYDALRFDDDDEVLSHVRWFVGDRLVEDLELLDVGCGTGRYSAEFSRNGFDVIGLDHSNDQLTEAQSKGVPVQRGQAEELPFAADRFDAVSFIMMLHQLSASQFKTAMAEATRVLRIGGHIWIKTCSLDDLAVRPFTDLFPSTLEINAKRYQKIDELIRVIKRSGAQLKRMETLVNHYEMSGAQIIDRTQARHNTTLFLMKDEEFRAGLEGLKMRYKRNENYQLSHQHTLLEFEVG